MLVYMEKSIYWIVWVLATVYALHKFATICQTENHLIKLNVQDFKDGFLSQNLYDASDFEWQSFKKLYINYWYIHLIHFALSNVLTVYKQPALKLATWIFITLYATYTVFSVGALVVVIINVIMLILLAILGKNVLSYILCFGVVLASKSTEIANKIFNPNDPRMTNEFDFEEKRLLFTYCLCFLNVRGLSAALDNLTERKKKEIQSGKDQFYEKVVTIAAYLLYLPGFFAGPIYLYNGFERATRLVKAEPTKEVFLGANYLKSMKVLFILIANIICYEWLLHWLYSSAVSDEYQLVNNYDSWQLSGLVVSLCLLFYMKYTCIFGAFRVLATFDGLSSISPRLPQCVLAMHLGSQLWRNFDVGLYTWLKKYIYLPIIRDRRSVFRVSLATLTGFACITLWHLPLSMNLIMWISLNTIGAFIEIWARSASKTSFWTSLEERTSDASLTRILALIGVPLFLLTVSSNLFFLSSNEQIPNEFITRIFTNTDNFTVYLLLALFCGANVSLSYNRAFAQV